jgi:hypothetical protein
VMWTTAFAALMVWDAVAMWRTGDSRILRRMVDLYATHPTTRRSVERAEVIDHHQQHGQGRAERPN